MDGIPSSLEERVRVKMDIIKLFLPFSSFQLGAIGFDGGIKAEVAYRGSSAR